MLPTTYIDMGHTIQNGSAPYSIQTYWQYLVSYYDSNSGAGGRISYQQAHNNAEGTPYSNGDNRLDPFYCNNHACPDPFYCNNHACPDPFSTPDNMAWSEQVVTQITTVGRDSSGVSTATTSSAYQLAVTNHSCPADSQGNTACVGDNYIPKGNTGNKDQDWMDFYHSEFRGFNVVYTTSPASNLTIGYYYSTEGWWTVQGDAPNLITWLARHMKRISTVAPRRASNC